MKLQRYMWVALGTAAVSVLTLGGCVVTPGPDPYYTGGVVMKAPPPQRVEIIGTAPYPGYIWIGGFWSWHNHRHEWVPGRWEAPRHGNHWVPHRWDRDGKYWRERRGHWERD